MSGEVLAKCFMFLDLTWSNLYHARSLTAEFPVARQETYRPVRQFTRSLFKGWHVSQLSSVIVAAS